MVHFINRAVAASVALAISGVVLAADAAPELEEELEEVTVTGSRIQAAVGMSTPTPVASLSIDELKAMAPASLSEALVQLPQFYNSQTAENFGPAAPAPNGYFQSPGGGSLNLRGIGTKRTLTLLDGHRMVPSTAFGGPDINTFPDDVLKRIEVVTGGASAAYGTDAVSGVVNYILDTTFEGFRGTAQMGVTERGDGENQKYSMSIGHAFGDKMHMLFSASHSKQKEIVGYQGRDWYKGCGYMQNPSVAANVSVISTAIPPLVPSAWNDATYVPGNGGYSQDTPRLVPACNLHNTQMNYDGLVTVGSGASARLYELDQNGAAIPFYRTLPATGPAATSAVMPGGGGQNLAYTDTQLLPASARKNVFAYLDYDISDNLTVYAQGMFGWQTLSYFARVGDFANAPPQAFTIQRNNAFLPTSLAAIMDAAGVTTATMTRAGTREDWGGAGSFTNTNNSTTMTAGFRSTVASEGFFNDWNVDGYVQLGKNKLDAAQKNGIRLDRVYLAADAVRDTNGAIRCNVTVVSGLVPDCVPLNIFGRGNASQGAIDWITGFDPDIAVTTIPFLGYDEDGLPLYASEPYSYVGDEHKHRLLTLEQKVFEFNANGKVADGWAGPINAAFGAHWRKESIDQKVQASQGNSAADGTYFPVWCPDAVVATNSRCISQVNRGIRPPGAIGVRGVPGNPFQNTVEIQFSNVPFVAGSFTVKELYAETIVPLLAEKPLLQKLNFQGALRWADYAGSGTIWSYKAGLDADIVDGFRLRGTYSHDTRAANIAERFDRTGGFTQPISDRVSPLPTGWIQPSQVTTVNGGNPDLTPEEADTLTAGFVYRPTWLPGFDLSVDWLQVKLKNAIEQLLAQRVIDACYFEGDTEQCNRIVRDSGTNVILFVPQTYENLSKSYHESVDLEIGYSRKVQLLGGNERLSARLFTTYLIENSTTNSQGVKTDFTGNAALQNYRKKAMLTLRYDNGPLNVSLTSRYNGGGVQGTTAGNFNQVRDLAELNTPPVTTPPTPPTATRTGERVMIWDVADPTFGATVYWDTRIGYHINVGNGQLELFANVTNLLDRDPPRIYSESLVGQSGYGFDELGRRFVAGFNLKF